MSGMRDATSREVRVFKRSRDWPWVMPNGAHNFRVSLTDRSPSSWWLMPSWQDIVTLRLCASGVIRTAHDILQNGNFGKRCATRRE
jgi:hypothetical protein